MNLEMKGKIAKVLDIQKGVSKAGKEWVKTSVILDNGNQFNPEVWFKLFGQEKVDMLKDFNVGDDVEVLFNLSSREYNGNYYTSCDIWKMKKLTAQDAFNEMQEMADELASNDGLPF